MGNLKSSQLFKLCFKWIKFAHFSQPSSIQKDFLHETADVGHSVNKRDGTSFS